MNLQSSQYQMRFRFGDVFSLQLAWKPVIVLNGLAAVREVLVSHSDDISDRPWMPIYEHLGFGPRSQGVILAGYGPVWREQRRFSVSTMHNFGLGRKSLEQWVTTEASCLCTAFTTKAGGPFSPKTLLNRAVCNVISSLIYAHCFKYDDQRLAKMLHLLEDALKEHFGLVMHVVPVFLRIPGLPGRVFPIQKAFMGMVDELLEEHRMTWDPAQPPRDLTDAFLVEVEKAKGSPESSFNDENLRMVVLDLFTAGMVTTSTTLAWALLLMILHPDVQCRRVCLGEPLARMELFLFFTCLLQRFSFSVPPGQARPSDYGVFGSIVTPSLYQLCAEPR